MPSGTEEYAFGEDERAKMQRRRKRRRLLRRRRLLLGGVVAALLLSIGIYRHFTQRTLSAPAASPVAAVVPPPGPPGIVIHHSESPAVYHGIHMNAARLEAIHAKEHPDWATVYEGKTYHIGYHFVILPNGIVEQGRPEGCVGAHARSHNDWLGICLIGGFQTDNHWWPEQPTKAQMQSLIALCERLMSKYHIPPDYVKRHRDINDTWCPGDRFPYNNLLTELRAYAAVHPETRALPGRIVSLDHPPPPGHKKKKDKGIEKRRFDASLHPIY